ncbi:hypothetical protein [Pseudomonas yamanorum]|uniref:Uncharacterized protein n=1 Tax=Pseudomonas yamanorum TaxID=515393 RepID=A0A7Y8FBV8_9PSED|nr:hypothetical protein [Pseudomonas yamanorum]NWE76034.1 hypothetical protein [Pseudomonas yamanorum]
MTDHNEALANALELLTINQNGLGAAIEELAKWVGERGSTDVAHNAVSALEVIDLNADGISSAIRLLRSE